MKKGYVYVLHFHEKLGHAQHYTGWTVDVEARIAKHRVGTGGRLPAVFASLGVSFTVGRIWTCATTNEARSLEWRIKHKWKKVHRYCTECHPPRALDVPTL